MQFPELERELARTRRQLDDVLRNSLALFKASIAYARSVNDSATNTRL